MFNLSGRLVSDDPAGEEADCGGPGLVWLHVVCGFEAGWTATLVDIPAVSMPIARSPQLETSVALCDTAAHFSGLLLSPAQSAPV
jgi:hypothetical protein